MSITQRRERQAHGAGDKPRTDFEKFHYRGLQKECKRLGLPAGGTGAELLARLKEVA